MSGMFRDAAAFNGDISPWDVSSVTDMGTMFTNAPAFNQNISLWDVSSVTDMRFIFTSAGAFNGDISLWDVPSVTDMGYMFYKASAFNQNISTWDVSSVENMDSMFYDAAAFAQNLGKWYVIPADTAYDTGEGTLNVTTISAQNAILDGQEPDYGIGTGGDSDLFNMTGSALMSKSTPPSADTYEVNVTAPGGDFGTGNHRILEITVTGIANTPPVLEMIGDRSVNELEALSFTAIATDVDHLAFGLTSAPQGASITAGGAFSWTPTELQDGNHTFTVTVRDSAGATDSETITVTVREVNVPPVLNSIGSRSVNELVTLAFTATVTDPDNNEQHTFSLADAPLGASITAGGAFSWTPTEPQDGTHTVTISVQDRFGATDSETITVTVREVNVPPVLNSIGSRSVNELVTLTFTATVTDPDNNEQHTFSLADAPLGASITAGGAFSWTPTEPQDGTHTVTISVQDRFGATDSETITVTVREVNVPPALVTIGDRSVDELETLSFTATVTDSDNNDVHTFSLVGAPTGAAITQDGTFSWTPTELQDGNHTFTVTVRDSAGATDSETITVTVNEVDHIRPMPLVGTGERNPTGSHRIAFWADFGERIRAGSFAAGDISVSSGRATPPSSSDGQNFTFAVTGAGEGTLTVSIPENAVRDIEGNWNEESNAISILVDRTAPVPTLSTAASSPTGAERIPFTATFDEPVDGETVEAGDIDASSGGVENLQFGGTTSFTFEIVGPATGTLRVGIPAGTVQDLAGNGNAASNRYEIVIDRDEPTPTVTALTGSPTNAPAVGFRVDFDKDINPSSFAAGDVDASSGTVSSPVEVNSRKFTFSVSGPEDGSLTVAIPSGRVQDTSGNPNIVSNTATVEIDRTGPKPEIMPVTASPTNAQTVTFEVGFGEEIRSGTFGSGDIEASSGRAAGVRAAGDSLFTFDVTGAGSGTLEVRIPAGGLQDVPGNDNTESNTATIGIDRNRPVPTITAETASPTNAQEIRFRVDFDKDVDASTFDAADIVMVPSRGEVSSLTQAGPRAFTFVVGDPAEGELLVRIPASRLQDTLGNPNVASNATGVTIDRTAPTPKLEAQTPSPTNSTGIVFKVDFGEQVRDGSFAAGGIRVGGGSVASGPDGTDGRTFEFTVRPSGDGRVTAQIPAGSAQDPAGNDNAGSNTASALYDGTAPQITAAYLVSPGRVVCPLRRACRCRIRQR